MKTHRIVVEVKSDDYVPTGEVREMLLQKLPKRAVRAGSKMVYWQDAKLRRKRSASVSSKATPDKPAGLRLVK